MIADVRPAQPLTGTRFRVSYLVAASAGEVDARVRSLALEQTVEFPEDLLPEGWLRAEMPGRVESLEPAGSESGWYRADLSFPDEAVGSDLLQFLNVVFGNASLQPGLRVVDFELPKPLARGPRFGVAGLRAVTRVFGRPLSATALKPLGLPVGELALQAYQTALGGIDLVKDDHGLADQPLARFQLRVERCAEAVAAANRETGRRSLYVPNITGNPREVFERARFAREAGAGAVLVAPGLAGFGALRELADDPDFGLPILAHPAFTGSFVSAGAGGIDPGLFYGTLMRAAGADVSVFPHAGGRFSFPHAACSAIAERCARPVDGVAAAFPSPAGGMSVARVPELKSFYGSDFVALIGGALHRESPSLVDASRRFAAALAREDA